MSASSRLCGVVPLIAGVDASAVAAGADADCRNAEREGNIRVRRSDARLGADAKVAVDGEQVVIERRAIGCGGQTAGGTVTDALDRESSLRIRTAFAQLGGRRVCRQHGVFDGPMQLDFQADQLFSRCGAEIEARAGVLRNCVDGTSAFNGANIQRRARFVVAAPSRRGLRWRG